MYSCSAGWCLLVICSMLRLVNRKLQKHVPTCPQIGSKMQRNTKHWSPNYLKMNLGNPPGPKETKVGPRTPSSQTVRTQWKSEKMSRHDFNITQHDPTLTQNYPKLIPKLPQNEPWEPSWLKSGQSWSQDPLFPTPLYPFGAQMTPQRGKF